MILKLEPRQAQFLRALIDLGVKTQGIAVARNAVILDDLIVAAMNEEAKENANVMTLHIPNDGTSGTGGGSG